jgi:hypothetical protein
MKPFRAEDLAFHNHMLCTIEDSPRALKRSVDYYLDNGYVVSGEQVIFSDQQPNGEECTRYSQVMSRV